MATKKTITKIKEPINVQSMHDKLSRKFATDEVEQRPGTGGMSLDFIPINKVYDRLNEVFPLRWDWSMDTPMITDKHVVIKGRLSITLGVDEDGYSTESITREGVGADKITNDIDKSVKTAMAEALKKAGHTLGIGLYLWNESERAQLERERLEHNRNKTVEISEKQRLAVKNIKSILKIDNDGLDPLIREWSEGKLSSRNMLNGKNIDDFITWVGKNKLESK